MDLSSKMTKSPRNAQEEDRREKSVGGKNERKRRLA